MGPLHDQLIIIFVGAVGFLIVAGWRALNRHHTIAHGKTAQATVLHVEKIEVKDYRYGPIELFWNVQVAIPRPDGVEFVATARTPMSEDPPKVGWVLPVVYLERLGTTAKVQIVGPTTPPL